MFLGIDLGTSEIKALLLDASHRVIGTAARPLTVQRPRPGWCEQAPADWWQAASQAVGALSAAHPDDMRAVQAIGLSGQMHGAVLLDRQDRVLRPAILWNDGRSAQACAELEARVPRLRDIAGNMAMPGFTAPKLRWVREHEPRVFEQVASVLLPKDWLRLEMTGEKFSDMSDASGTLWLDVRARSWSDELLAGCGLSAAHMPRLVEGSHPGGRLRAEVARAWGLRAGIPVAGGAGDNAASAVGVGAVHSHQGFLSLGTSGVIFLSQPSCSPRPDSAVHTFCHALPGMWHQMSVMLSAGSALRWACRLTHLDESGLLARVDALDAQARHRAPIFLPYLDGERTPHNDADARGVLFGLSGDHDAASVGYAVLEGVAFGLLDGWRCLQPAAASALPLAVVGGGARSATWCQLLASALGQPLRAVGAAQTGAALGAARLGWLAWGGNVAEVCPAAAATADYVPDPFVAEALAARGERFRSLYPLLRGVFGS